MSEVKVAVVQFTVRNDTARNLQVLLSKLDETAANGANLVVFAEFCNHPTWYRDQEDAWQNAVEVPGPFVQAIQDKARELGVHVIFNVTVRSERPTVYDQSHLISPRGEILGTARKQVLMYLEKNYYTPSEKESPVIQTDLGRIGMYSCMDGLIPETTRCLSVKGAQVLVNSLASNGLDEAHLHIPARAAENGVWVVAANRSGPIVDETDMPALVVQSGIPYDLLLGGGESQVISPRGEVLVRALLRQDDVAYAIIDPDLADDKSFAGGGDLMGDRRPDAYGLLTTPNTDIPFSTRTDKPQPSRELRVAAVQAACAESPVNALNRALALSAQACDEGARLLVLPELFAFAPGAISVDPALSADQSAQVVESLGSFAGERGVYMVASLVERADSRYFHTTFLLGAEGHVLASYRQVHVHPKDRDWATPGSQFVTADTPFGVVGLMSGYDGLFCESARVLARMGADVICYPTSWREQWEASLGVVERSAENHVAVIAANRPDSSVLSGSIIVRLPSEYAFPITGEVNFPLKDALPWGEDVVLHSTLDLSLSRDKKLMGMSDLLMDVRPELYGCLTAPARR